TTNFAAAFKEAFRAFEGADGDQRTDAARVLLVVSDGENFGEDYNESLDELVSSGVQVYTIGIGTVSGTNIPEFDPSTGRLLGHKRDRSGAAVITKLETETLRNIADTGNGQYYEVQRGNENFDAFLNRIGDLQKGEFASQEYADFKNQYQTVAIVGLAFLCMGILFPR